MENTISFNMPFFEKNPAYFFKAIRINNRIRDIINNCKTDNIDDIQDEKERDDVRSYLENRGCISMNSYSGYLKYTRNDYYNSKNSMVVKKCDIELSPDKFFIFDYIKSLLDKTLKSEVRTCFCKNDGYYCEEHKIHNHDCININDYYFDDYHYNSHIENGLYTIGYLDNEVYNNFARGYNKYYSKNIYKLTIQDTVYYIFKKPYKYKLFNKEERKEKEKLKPKDIIITNKNIKKDKIVKTKRYKNFYNLNKLFFLSYMNEEYEDDHGYENVNYFLTEDEIVDILDYYYFNKDFIDYNASYDFYSRMTFKEYLKSLEKEI